MQTLAFHFLHHTFSPLHRQPAAVRPSSFFFFFFLDLTRGEHIGRPVKACHGSAGWRPWRVAPDWPEDYWILAARVRAGRWGARPRVPATPMMQSAVLCLLGGGRCGILRGRRTGLYGRGQPARGRRPTCEAGGGQGRELVEGPGQAWPWSGVRVPRTFGGRPTFVAGRPAWRHGPWPVRHDGLGLRRSINATMAAPPRSRSVRA